MPLQIRGAHAALARRIFAAALTLIVAIGACLATQDNTSASIRAARTQRLNATIQNVYTDGYQRMKHDELVAARNAQDRTIDNIYTAVNPYGTDTTALYVYFTTEDATTVRYTVHADGYPDYSAQPAKDSAASTRHEFLVMGLVPGVSNTVTLTIDGPDGDSDTRTLTVNGPKLLGEEDVRLEASVPMDDDTVTALGQGLFAIIGNESNEQDFTPLYDANGVIRAEIPLVDYRWDRLLEDKANGLVWYTANSNMLVALDTVGRAARILSIGERFSIHHDIALDENGDIVALATANNTADKSEMDRVIRIDAHTGKVRELVNLSSMFAQYKAKTKRVGYGGSDATWDWIHVNTIQLTDGGGALLSSRETSTIIKIDDIEGTPKLGYMIGTPAVWRGTPWEQSHLTKVGDFPDSGGQHSITVVRDPSLRDGQYYLYMFDNNLGKSETRPGFDWAAAIKGVNTVDSLDAVESSGATSQFRRYLVDENARTYREVKEFDVPYSPYVSSVQELGDGRVLVDSGMQGVFGVYDESGSLLGQYKVKLTGAFGLVYRVYDYDMAAFFLG